MLISSSDCVTACFSTNSKGRVENVAVLNSMLTVNVI